MSKTLVDDCLVAKWTDRPLLREGQRKTAKETDRERRKLTGLGAGSLRCRGNMLMLMLMLMREEWNAWH